ncbi:unnamed protein product [Tenebrio molitor]|nr:unnamed protein product [Tenebrio molitor]
MRVGKVVEESINRTGKTTLRMKRCHAYDKKTETTDL